VQKKRQQNVCAGGKKIFLLFDFTAEGSRGQVTPEKSFTNRMKGLKYRQAGVPFK
jgi:hypothetical protein